jgi:hypothetical protein
MKSNESKQITTQSEPNRRSHIEYMHESTIGKKYKCITSCTKKYKRISDMLTLAAAAKSFFSLSVANQVLFGREYISSL